VTAEDAPATPSVGAVADAYVAALGRVDPVAARLSGQEPPLLPRLDPASVAARRDLAEDAVTALGEAEPVDRAEELLRSVMTERLGSEVALHDSGFLPGLVAPLASPAHAVVQALAGLTGEAAYEGLRRVPGTWADLKATWGTTSASGYTVPVRQSRVLAAQLRRWAEGDDDRFGPVAARVPADSPNAGRVGEVLAAARRSTLDLARWLEEVHAARGPQEDAVGPELYTVTSTAFLGTSVDLGETYAFGWELLRELTAEGEKIAARLGHDGIPAAERALDRDAGTVRVGEDLVRWATGRLHAAADALDGRVVDVPRGEEAAVAVQLAAPGSGSIYYRPGVPGGGRTAAVVWSPPVGADRLPVWREISTVHHEGVPGHHLQHVVAATTPGLHPWQRHLCHVHGYAEGWAHYVEERSDDWGLLRDDAERLGVVLARRWRAARVVVDLGLHLGLPIPADQPFTTATRWSPEVAVDLLVAVTGMDRGTASFEVDRYYGWPGQALAFSVGAREWRRARDRAVAADPSPEAERRFHTEALALGPMGLAQLTDHLAGPGEGGLGAHGEAC
jgi:uncharacterized protein (DUF885 family)